MTDKNKLIGFFQRSSLISLDRAEEIAELFEKRLIIKNEYQLTNRKICNEYLFLEEGFMRSYTYDVNQQEVTTGFFSSGHLVFEVSSFFNRTVSKENIQALTDCSGWYITYDQLNMLFHTIPEFREFGRSILVKGFAALKIRMLSMINETAEVRYVNLVKSNPEIFQHAPLKMIASYLGITDTSLSRIRKEFTKKD